MYQLKTMCLAKKAVQMPTKEEHGFLLFCGLGELGLNYIQLGELGLNYIQLRDTSLENIRV
jgi:hypothetical protein